MTLCKKTFTTLLSLTLALILSACGKSLVRRDGAPVETGNTAIAGRGLLTEIGLNEFSGGAANSYEFDPIAKVLSLNGLNLPSLSGSIQSPLLDMTHETLVGIAVLPDRPYNKELPALNLADSGYPNGNLSAADMVGYYRLNEGATGPYMDSSKNGRNATATAAPAPTAGILRSALKFDGTKLVTVNSLPDATDSLNLKRYPGGATWMAWFSNDTPLNGASLLSKGSEGNYRISFASTATDSSIQCSIFNTGQTRKLASAGVPKVTGWMHIACTYDGVSLKAYLNGLLVATTATTIGIGVGSAAGTVRDLYIGGGAATGNATRYKGSLDEVAIYSRPLPNEEIKSVYQRGEIFGVQYKAAATPQELRAKPCIGPSGTPDTYYLPVAVDSLNPPVFGVPAQKAMYVGICIRYAFLSNASRIVIRAVKPVYQPD